MFLFQSPKFYKDWECVTNTTELNSIWRSSEGETRIHTAAWKVPASYILVYVRGTPRGRRPQSQRQQNGRIKSGGEQKYHNSCQLLLNILQHKQ